MENPIKENRIIAGIHFSIRLLSFAKSMESGCACGEDEKNSMVSYACKLLEYQIHTATDKYELQYLEMNNAKQKLEDGKNFLENG
tara:strand:- start:515 stop:769 length:255 start_codon:yes stop_codon:yes gene_type:complete